MNLRRNKSMKKCFVLAICLCIFFDSTVFASNTGNYTKNESYDNSGEPTENVENNNTDYESYNSSVLCENMLRSSGATFDDINQSSVFLKQQTYNTCTLSAAAMLLRRTAMATGNSNWSSITEGLLRNSLWTANGLSNSFSYAGITVQNSGLPSSGITSKTNHIIGLLKEHPEGVILYNSSRPHAVLLTDYTNGTFYCADPWYGTASGRIPLSGQSMVTINNCTSYWAVTNPKVTLRPSDTTPPVVSNVRIEDWNTSSMGYVITCDISDNVGVTRVAFPSWTHANGDLIWHEGIINGNTACCYIDTASHSNRMGTYRTDVYAYDAANNMSSPVSIDVNIIPFNAPTKNHQTVKDGVYTFKNQVGWMMDNANLLDQNGNPMIMYEFNGSGAQQFRVEHQGDGKYYIYQNACSSGRVLDVRRGDNLSDPLDQGDTLELWDKNDPEAQLFYIVPLSDGSYMFELASKDNLVIGGKHSYSNQYYHIQQAVENAESQRWYFCDLNGNRMDPTPEIKVSSLQLSNTNINLKVQEKALLRVTVLPATASNKTYKFTSSNTNVATVDSNGNILAKSIGNANIVCTAQDGSGISTICKVTVSAKQIPLSSISLNMTNASIYKGNSTTLKVSYNPSNTTDGKNISWTSSNTKIVTVDNSGNVKGVGVGTAIITAKVGLKTATCTVIVSEQSIPLTSISLNTTNAKINVGDNILLKAFFTPTNTTDNKAIKWVSNNTNIVTVDLNGNVKGISSGSAIVTATVGSKSATCNITVTKSANTDEIEKPVEAFVQRLYKEILGRNADASGLKMWADVLSSGKEQGAKVAQGFVESTEMKKRNLSDDAYIKALYRTFLNREADSSGLKGWKGVLDSGLSRMNVFKGFAESVEFTKICKEYGIIRGNAELTAPMDQNEGVTKFVVRCYNLCLARKADDSGLNAWCNQILTGKNSSKEVAYGFVFSVESKNKNLTNSEYIKMLYRVFMNREADNSGLNAWINVLNTGKDREHVFNGFADSIEFKKICDSYGVK